MSFKIIKFIDQVHKEALKVSWATRKEVIASSTLVVIMIVISTLVFLATDLVILKFVQYLLELGR